MKQIFGLKIGGLQSKILNLVLVFLVALVIVFSGNAYYLHKNLSDVVSEARTQQQEAIRQTSQNTMHEVIENTMVKSTEMQAKKADAVFAEIEGHIYMLQHLAESLFVQSDTLPPAEFHLPDPSLDGTLAAQVLHEEGVDYTQSKLLPVAAHMTDTMIALCKSSSKIDGCYIGLSDGTHLGVDVNFSEKYDENGNLIPFPVRERPWYTGAVEKNGVYFTGIERDAFNHTISITCSAPVIVNNKLIGVVGIDIDNIGLDIFEDLDTEDIENGFSYIVNQDGEVIAGPEEVMASSEEAGDLRKSKNTALAEFITSALSGKTGLTSVAVGDRTFYMAGAQMETAGWAVISIVKKELLELPAQEMLTEYDRINENASASYEKSLTQNTRAVLVITIVLFLLGGITAMRISRRIVKPLEEITKSVEAAKTGKHFEMCPMFETGDEIEVLAEAFDDLSKKTKSYIKQITEITKEKERISTELMLAKKIQADMLREVLLLSRKWLCILTFHAVNR